MVTTGPESRQASGTVEVQPGLSIGVQVQVDETVDSWLLSVEPSAMPRTGSGRLLKSVTLLCALDAVQGRRLERGETVQLKVLKLDGEPPTSRTSDEIFRVADLVRPLLMTADFDEPLYDYQRAGVAWLLRHDRSLLADDMGLGKTLQVIAGARRLIRYGKAAWVLVVAPRALLTNWVAELHKWSPELAVATALPAGPERERAWGRLARRAHVTVTSYEQIRNPPDALRRFPPDLIVADEAHRLRRLESQASRGMRTLSPVRLWALTGTPLERDAEDVATLMSVIDPQRFSAADGALHPTQLRAQARPYILRRTKSGVLDELPAVVEREEQLELTDEQRTAYDSAVINHSRRPDATSSYLALFTELRSICDVDTNSGSSSKLDRIVELVTTQAAVGEKAVVFSYLLAPLKFLADRLRGGFEELGSAYLDGSMTLPDRDRELTRFRDDPDCSVLLASSRVASEGLTLTEANHVHFLNRWWNPSANAQARDRLLRIGQGRTVFVYNYTCRATVEDRLGAILVAKSLAFDELIDALEAGVGDDLTDALLGGSS